MSAQDATDLGEQRFVGTTECGMAVRASLEACVDALAFIANVAEPYIMQVGPIWYLYRTRDGALADVTHTTWFATITRES